MRDQTFEKAWKAVRRPIQNNGPTMLSLADIDPPEYMDGSAFLGNYKRRGEPQYIFASSDRYDAGPSRGR